MPRLGSNPSDEQVDELLSSSWQFQLELTLWTLCADLVDHFGLRVELEVGGQHNEQEIEEQRE